ncbi:hypothetical protein FHT87_004597 [Rhizobium sp. BK316]|uniref:phage gp6-like head-tail connector protein n=1 Tax=Rhizobium sp. BK316 TaxID=2587053 RepID=UPI001610E763|nr:phage gp6-like head-tail connector protein [Rhizobium sp. BK316]MBB3410665.1 hypothetical protein [Rhizobium sp. BK316]
MFHVTEQEVWQALQVDLYATGGSPETQEPADRAYIATLITAAQNRLDDHLATKLIDWEEVPAELKLAITMDVTINYFDRKSPVLPEQYFYLIRPFRNWGFGYG